MNVRMFVSVLTIGFFTVSGGFMIETPVKGDEKKSRPPAATEKQQKETQQAAPSGSSASPNPATPVPAASPIKNLSSPPKYTVQMYKDHPGQTFSKEEEDRFNKVSELLMQIKPEPAQRLAYFSWMNRPDCPFKFYSWGCMLREAKPIEGGWKVTLQAMARGRDAEGHHYDVFNRYIEEYTLTESGKIKFIRGYPHPEDGDGSPSFRKFK